MGGRRQADDYVNTRGLLVAVVLNVCFHSDGQAATINVPSCSSAHVQSAINAAADGDTLLVPPGDCTWNTAV